MTPPAYTQLLLEYQPFEIVSQTHAEAVGARLHASPNHQSIAGLEDVERAGHSGEGHGAHKYRHILVKTEKERRKNIMFVFNLCN